MAAHQRNRFYLLVRRALISGLSQDPGIRKSSTSMSYQHIVTEIHGGVGLIRFNRPQARNALTFAMYERLYALCGEIVADESLRAVVFAGAGGKAFVAGTDIGEFEAFTTPEHGLHYEERMDAIIGAVERLPVPTIAALRGACTGGGLALASACDLRVAAPDARIGFPMARTLGNCLAARNLARMIDLIGPAPLKELLFTAELMDAQRAYQLGFHTEVVATPEALDDRVAALATLVAGNAPLTVRATKETMRRIAEQGRNVDDRDVLLSCYRSNDFREGMTAFFEKRPARWTGK
jgi:enoyl-CoA hydratase